MSDAFYIGLRDATAGPLIEKYGMALTLRRIVKGTYNNDTGATGADTYVDYPCFGVSDTFNSYIVANSLVRRDDQKLILSAKNLPVVPIVGDRFIFPDGTVWVIPDDQGSLISKFQPIQVVAPGGIAVIYNIQVRK